MGGPPDRRHVARLSVPRRLSGPELALRFVRLLDVSSEGARIEHGQHLNEGLVCFVDLPPALGRVRLTAQVVWTRLHEGEQTLEGDRHRHYQSGLVFTGITCEQQSALAAAQELIQSAPDPPI